MTTPAIPRSAATVLLVRDGADGLEVYLVRRVKGMPFAGGMTAYPGGSVDPRDADESLGWVGPPPSEWATSFRCDESLARELVCAAVRETFEEAGLLLASVQGGDVLDVTSDEWEGERQRLLDHSQSLAELLERRGLVLRADLLRPWAHWITPEGEPRRYDTRFFLAAVPAGVTPRNIGGEADLEEWVAPKVAVAQAESGARPMLTPTIFTLKDLAEFDTVEAVLAGAPPRPLQPIIPVLEYDGDDEFVVLPDGSRARTPIRLGKNRSVAD